MAGGSARPSRTILLAAIAVTVAALAGVTVYDMKGRSATTKARRTPRATSRAW